MIISASRRTDIPAYYFEWFVNRLKAGYLVTQNPINKNQYGKIYLNTETVDLIVFWTKNPKMDYFDTIKKMGYNFYVQFTITPYNEIMEPYIDDKTSLMNNFELLSNKIGKENIIWRYDPIILNEELNIKYHIKSFEYMTKRLSEYSEECIISFIDVYDNIKNIKNINEKDMRHIAFEFSNIAEKYSIKLKTCAEKIDLEEYSISRASCIDKNRIEKVLGCKIISKKDANQRNYCGCIESIDIGCYDSCPSGCIYCYANGKREKVYKNIKNHDAKSDILIGNLNNKGMDFIVKEKKLYSLKEVQKYLF